MQPFTTLGHHTYTAIRKPSLHIDSDLEELLKTHSVVKPLAVPTAKLTTMIREGQMWWEVENVAKAMHSLVPPTSPSISPAEAR